MKSEHVDLENISLQITFQELLIGKKKNTCTWNYEILKSVKIKL